MDTTTAILVYAGADLPRLSMFGVILILLVLLPLSAVAGHALGRRQRQRTLAAGREIDQTMGQTSLTTILGLLGLLLAFSFGNAMSVAQTRKLAVIDEAAALGTVFLRADYLPEPARTELKTAIHAYTQTRVIPEIRAFGGRDNFHLFLETSLEAQSRLWPLTVAATADPVPPPVATFVASAMNEALDAHLYRMQTLSLPVSDNTRLMLLAAAMVSLLLLGNRAGILGRDLSWRTFVTSLFLFIVMVAILDIERGQEGFVRVDQTPLLATLFDMETALR
jgi:hypothetical protein